ncbi:MAG: DNA polymerase III subunit delta [Lachnospiraceae bacterium]|nr:DNA polymerase III subunit delta [Lachnospiraceae bacterium]MBQ6196524.1 DNA polymerase III subunit delta [Lachnospiraceae bacterium]
MKKIKSDIELGAFEPVYLIYGPEAYSRKQLKAALRQAVCGDETMNYTYREGRDVVTSEIREIAETLPFFAEKRLIVLENSGLLKKGGEEMAAYIPEIPETTIIVFVEEEIDKRSKLYKAIEKCGYVSECARRTEAELEKFALTFFARRGQRITGEAMALFLERGGEDMEHLLTEMEKLSAYAHGRDIFPEDVKAITSVTAQNRVFEMLDAMLRKKPKIALELYADLKALREPPMRILYLMTQQVNRLLQIKEMDRAGARSDAMAQATGLRPFAVRKYLQQAQLFTEAELRGKLERLSELDFAVKSGTLSDSMAVELVLADFGR